MTSRSGASGCFFRGAIAPKDRNLYRTYLSGSLGGRGIFDGRPYDRMGVGVYWLKRSDDLNAPFTNLIGNEFGVETFYNRALTPWRTVSGDWQWIQSGLKNVDNLGVLGLRTNAQF